MAKSVLKIKQLNPRFNYHLFDDKDCENFIKTHFKPDVLNAFKKLIPGAYKADLWRYCILYIKGGIYLDIKYKPHNKFRFINLTESEHFCLDIDGVNIYNAVMVCKPGNISCLDAIRKIVKNVETRYYGSSSLDPTGPGLLIKCLTNEDKRKINMKHELFNGDFSKRYVSFNNFCILRQYDHYLGESARFGASVGHYSQLWANRKIYKK